jgi:hypothetical protein
MLPAATERILRTLPDDALVLDVGGWAAPFNRADWVLDAMPFASRAAADAVGPAWERFSAATWVERDPCDRAPWPWADNHFDFAVCLATLEAVRDPIWVCQELARVAKAGYVEVPTVEAELVFDAKGGGPWLGSAQHRWLCELTGGELVFTHKPHSLHHDRSLRVLPRWREGMGVEDSVQGLFWEHLLPARERLLNGDDHQALLVELRQRLRRRFEPSTTELRTQQARDVARLGLKLARTPARTAAERVVDELQRLRRT